MLSRHRILERVWGYEFGGDGNVLGVCVGYLQKKTGAAGELRTPLTSLSGNVELLRREPPIDAADRAEVLAGMASKSHRLIRLVNDPLALARADARQLLQGEPVPVKPLVEEVCRQTQLIDPERGIDCEAPAAVAVRAQAGALMQIMLILLDNALKHAAGAIAVRGEVLGDRVALRAQSFLWPCARQASPSERPLRGTSAPGESQGDAGATGSVKRKVLPWPGELSAQMRPP